MEKHYYKKRQPCGTFTLIANTVIYPVNKDTEGPKKVFVLTGFNLEKMLGLFFQGVNKVNCP